MAMSRQIGLCVAVSLVALGAIAGCGGDAAIGEVEEALSVPEKASNPNPGSVVPPNKRYEELSAHWVQWVSAIEGSVNPLFDPTGENALQGQQRPVYFLAGVVCIIQPDGSCTGPDGPVVREVDIPLGVQLFFPILNVWADDVGLPELLPAQCANLYDSITNTIFDKQTCATRLQDEASSVSAWIDGVPVAGLGNPDNTIYRVQSGPFTYTMPEDNLYDVLGVEAEQLTQKAAGDGVFLLLTPLSKGVHTIQFKGESENGFSLDVTYILTVGEKN